MKIIIASGAVVAVLLIALFTIGGPSALAPAPEEATIEVGGEIRTDTFTGTLRAVDTSCFSDGECSVTVNDKKVTILMGWSTSTVGSIIGAPSIGDLESYIGQSVEVYAQDNADGTYTLYGSESFYVKVFEENLVPNKPISPPVTSGSCVVGGCSGQLCVDASAGEGMVTTCEYREVYACYKTASCERQTTGQCGWTETTELTACIAAAE